MPILPEYSLSGRVAILATAGGDQAPYLAQALAEAGASVFAVARRSELLDPVLEALDSSGSHGGVVADAATPAGIAQVMEAFDRRHSQVDILVNDAPCVPVPLSGFPPPPPCPLRFPLPLGGQPHPWWT